MGVTEGKTKMSNSIEKRLALWVISSVTLILAFSLGYNYTVSKKLITKEIEETAIKTLQATINRMDIIFFSMEKATKTLSIPMEDSRVASNKENIFFLLQRVVAENREVYGSTVAFEPYAFGSHRRFFAPYYYKYGGKLSFRFIPYNYFAWGWYMVPKLLHRAVWVEPYFDKEAGDIVMSTYSVPLYKTGFDKKEFFAIATVDISLKWLQGIVSSIKIGHTGYGFLLSKKGTFVTHPDNRLIMRKTIFDVAKERSDRTLSSIGLEMIRGKTYFVPYSGPFVKKPCWMAYAPLRSNGWSLGIIFPKQELLQDVQKLNRQILFISLLGFFFLLLVIGLIAKGITRPLRFLATAADQIATGDWETPLPPVRHDDEVGKLTRSFEHMKASLKKYFNDLKETTAARERIESELRIARDIQMGLVPKEFPPFPGRQEFEIHAILEPAREVGGDLYDFFFTDETHLCFLVGDVSGKGVPASLFMAMAKTLIKSIAAGKTDPAAIVRMVNHDLAADNPFMMFVTLFLGILDIETGSLSYCNGGHNPPFLLRFDGEIFPLISAHELALGVSEDFVYSSSQINLLNGDILFVYTDGVTEAMDPKGVLFNEQRLQDTLSGMEKMTVQEINQAVLKAVSTFADTAPQADDITMLALKFNQKGKG